MIDVYQQNGIDFFSCIKDIIEKKFEQEVRRADSFQIPEGAYDPLRHQYHAYKIIAAISTCGVNNRFNLGVVQDDIFVHRMNFVFGLADRRSRTALVSSYRLAGTNLIDRLSKEIVHELGHLTGLGHCPDPRCVMHFSNTPNDTDQKTTDLCPTCRSING